MTSTPTKRLIATIGLPASGKTTWTLTQIAADPTGVGRANRDALRIACGGRRHGTGRQEAVVTDAQLAMIRSLYLHGYHTVIVDDTNLRGVGRLRKLAAELGVTFDVQDFRTVTLETCLRRNKIRPAAEFVPESEIRRMHDDCVLPWLRACARREARAYAVETR